jgi:kinesin family protein 5
MQGNIKDSAARGVMPRSLDLIFDHINRAGAEVEFALKVSYMELYCEKVKDLLKAGNDNLKIAETPEEGVHVPDATQGEFAAHGRVYAWVISKLLTRVRLTHICHACVCSLC